MKNVTLRVDERVLGEARRYAAAHGVSLNALVRDFLSDLAGREERVAAARARLRVLSEASLARLPADGRTWSRSELHER